MDLIGDHVRDALGTFEATSDQQRGRGSGDTAVAGPDAGRADHVDDAGLVLEAQEGGTAGCGRALAMRHDPAYQHAAAWLDPGQAVGGHRPKRVEPLAQELDGVAEGR